MAFDPTLQFKYLKHRVSIYRVLEAYGLHYRLRRRGHTMYGCCPLHSGNNPTAFHVHMEKEVWNCFTACGGGDVVDLIRKIEQCSYPDAARYLKSLITSGPAIIQKQYRLHQQKSSMEFRPFTQYIPLDSSCEFLQKS